MHPDPLCSRELIHPPSSLLKALSDLQWASFLGSGLSQNWRWQRHVSMQYTSTSYWRVLSSSSSMQALIEQDM